MGNMLSLFKASKLEIANRIYFYKMEWNNIIIFHNIS